MTFSQIGFKVEIQFQLLKFLNANKQEDDACMILDFQIKIFIIFKKFLIFLNFQKFENLGMLQNMKFQQYAHTFHIHYKLKFQQADVHTQLVIKFITT